MLTSEAKSPPDLPTSGLGSGSSREPGGRGPRWRVGTSISSRLEVWAGQGLRRRGRRLAAGHWPLAPGPPLASQSSLSEDFGLVEVKSMKRGQEWVPGP